MVKPNTEVPTIEDIIEFCTAEDKTTAAGLNTIVPYDNKGEKRTEEEALAIRSEIRQGVIRARLPLVWTAILARSLELVEEAEDSRVLIEKCFSPVDYNSFAGARERT